jgi:hypothetical protein
MTAEHKLITNTMEISPIKPTRIQKMVVGREEIIGGKMHMS